MRIAREPDEPTRLTSGSGRGEGPQGPSPTRHHKHVWPDVQAAHGEAPTTETQPMVYDGYYGRFVPVEAASFDVAVTPDAVVELPRGADRPEELAARGAPGRTRRRRRTAADERP